MYIQVGTAALRAPDGTCKQSEPIYRYVPDSEPLPTEDKNRVRLDLIEDLFTERAEAYLSAERNRKIREFLEGVNQ